jgi:Domain of unknown function (DUF1844)
MRGCTRNICGKERGSWYSLPARAILFRRDRGSFCAQQTGVAASVGKVNGMSQERKSFTVNDRRHFTSEGEPREDPEATPAPAPPSNQAEQAAPTTAEPSSAAFGPFILSLAAQAGYLLAAEGEEAARSLEDARHLIAILEMLKDKSEGRRTPEEDGVLETVLYELRMGYVARTRAGGA